ncbi:MAG: DNA cytosine methyltransferase, partial [Nitrospinota bacterium]|nr:DNA cytosine methyltransferase [Nitrospinota bacterium]
MGKMKYYEFFAGGGMARAGLGDGWECLLANDNDAAKAECYRRHFNAGDELVVRDVASIKLHDLPGRADLAWASFPCQDLSLAGGKKGLAGARSGAFWPFWRLIEGLGKQNRAPRTIVLENVQGAVTSHGGQDLAAIVKALAKQDYRFSP